MPGRLKLLRQTAPDEGKGGKFRETAEGLGWGIHEEGERLVNFSTKELNLDFR